MGMKVYKRDTSGPCRSVFMVLELLGIKDVEYIHMNLIQREHFSEEYLKVTKAIIIIFIYRIELKKIK